MRVRAIWLASSLLVGCTFGSLTGGGGGVTIGGDDDGATGSTGGDVSGGPGNDDGGPTSGATEGADTTDGCTPGLEGCACDGRVCEAGSMCVQGSCVANTCGNGELDADELCDDGNLQVGDGCDACEPSPGVKSVVAGSEHTCALLWTGDVRCWGESASGRLGYGNVERVGDDEHPWEAGNVPLGGHAVALSAGGDFTCALLDDATVRCWGNHAAGRLGNQAADEIGDDEPASESATVELGGDAVQIACSAEHCCALRADNSVLCWGEGGQGRLGHGNQDDIGVDDDPEEVGPVIVGGDVRQVAAGGEHTCAVLVNDDLVCWGNGANGRLGHGSNTSIADNGGQTPARAGRVPLTAAVQSVRLGGQHTCALILGGDVRCWGRNDVGQCGFEGDGSIGDVKAEIPDVLDDLALGQPVVSIGARGAHSCAVLEDGTVKCWGSGANGRLGYEATTDVWVPPREPVAISADQRVVRVALGGAHTCAMLDLGNVRCWGRGDTGALGYANLDSIGDTPGNSPQSAGDVQVLTP